MSETKMRFRTDSPVSTEPKATFQAGDTFRIYWYHMVNGKQVDDQLAGYMICCPKCLTLHSWTSAKDCKVGTSPTQVYCDHQRNRTSCWTWTGSAEDNKLSASPSLQVVKGKDQPCDWHGVLTDGVLIGG